MCHTNIMNMKYTRHLSTIGFYPNRYWFYYFFKFKNIRGFKIRIFGIEFMIKEENSLSKLIAIAHEQNEATRRKSKLKIS